MKVTRHFSGDEPCECHCDLSDHDTTAAYAPCMTCNCVGYVEEEPDATVTP